MTRRWVAFSTCATKGNVILITGTQSQVHVQTRIRCFKAQLAKTPGLKIVENQDGNCSPMYDELGLRADCGERRYAEDQAAEHFAHETRCIAVYRQRAEKWWQQMKSRMRLRESGKYSVWNYWDPAGPWDSKPDGTPKHWVGVHPNGGYYGIDVKGIVTAYEHGLVFTRAEIDRHNRLYLRLL